MHRMTSQLPGVFYRRPAPDQDPYIEEGAVVEVRRLCGHLGLVAVPFHEAPAQAQIDTMRLMARAHHG